MNHHPLHFADVLSASLITLRTFTRVIRCIWVRTLICTARERWSRSLAQTCFPIAPRREPNCKLTLSISLFSWLVSPCFGPLTQPGNHGSTNGQADAVSMTIHLGRETNAISLFSFHRCPQGPVDSASNAQNGVGYRTKNLVNATRSNAVWDLLRDKIELSANIDHDGSEFEFFHFTDISNASTTATLTSIVTSRTWSNT